MELNSIDLKLRRYIIPPFIIKSSFAVFSILLFTLLIYSLFLKPFEVTPFLYKLTITTKSTFYIFLCLLSSIFYDKDKGENISRFLLPLIFIGILMTLLLYVVKSNVFFLFVLVSSGVFLYPMVKNFIYPRRRTIFRLTLSAVPTFTIAIAILSLIVYLDLGLPIIGDLLTKPLQLIIFHILLFIAARFFPHNAFVLQNILSGSSKRLFNRIGSQAYPYNFIYTKWSFSRPMFFIDQNHISHIEKGSWGTEGSQVDPFFDEKFIRRSVGILTLTGWIYSLLYALKYQYYYYFPAGWTALYILIVGTSVLYYLMKMKYHIRGEIQKTNIKHMYDQIHKYKNLSFAYPTFVFVSTILGLLALFVVFIDTSNAIKITFIVIFNISYILSYAGNKVLKHEQLVFGNPNYPKSKNRCQWFERLLCHQYNYCKDWWIEKYMINCPPTNGYIIHLSQKKPVRFYHKLLRRVILFLNHAGIPDYENQRWTIRVEKLLLFSSFLLLLFFTLIRDSSIYGSRSYYFLARIMDHLNSSFIQLSDINPLIIYFWTIIVITEFFMMFPKFYLCLQR